MELTVAIAQMAIATGDLARNEATAREAADRAADAARADPRSAATLLLLPELWHTGYDLDRAQAYATPLEAATVGGAASTTGAFALMANLAREHGLYVAGSALETNPEGRPYNTAALFGPDGALLGSFRKVHLWAPMGEAEHMTAGSDLPVWDLPWGRTALAVCYDLRFPELWRSYAAAGASIVLIPAEWPERRVEHWRLLLRARAIENQIFVVGCNRAGAEPDGEGTIFGGHSAAVDPWARVLVEGGAEPGLFVARLDLAEVDRARRLFPFWQDRRPEVYG